MWYLYREYIVNRLNFNLIYMDIIINIKEYGFVCVETHYLFICGFFYFLKNRLQTLISQTQNNPNFKFNLKPKQSQNYKI